MAIVVIKTVVTVLTVLMMLTLLLFAKGANKASVVGFTYMEMLYTALLWLIWRG